MVASPINTDIDIYWYITKNWNLRLTRKNLDGSKLSYKYIILDLFLEF